MLRSSVVSLISVAIVSGCSIGTTIDATSAPTTATRSAAGVTPSVAKPGPATPCYDETGNDMECVVELVWDGANHKRVKTKSKVLCVADVTNVTGIVWKISDDVPYVFAQNDLAVLPGHGLITPGCPMAGETTGCSATGKLYRMAFDAGSAVMGSIDYALQVRASSTGVPIVVDPTLVIQGGKSPPCKRAQD